MLAERDRGVDAANWSQPATGIPRAVRITRLVSRPGMGAELVERCRRIADRERDNHPAAYRVVQARQPLDGDRVEVVSITHWIDLELMSTLVPAGEHAAPAFHEEYADCLESWRVEVFEVTWPMEARSPE